LKENSERGNFKVHEVYRVAASIVTYNNPIIEVKLAAQSFLACALPVNLLIIDNNSSEGYLDQLQQAFKAQFIRNGVNKGFGAGHNIGIKNAPYCDYYLVLNPDIKIHEGSLEKLVSFMDEHPEIGIISPKILNEDGSIQYLNKRLPTVFDLFARRFLPSFIQNISFIKKRMDYYIMLDKGYKEIQEVPYITGCFMLFRKSVLDKVEGFDENFFMYLEDTDITRRVNQAGFKSVYYPYASVTHKWARGSHHSIKLTWINIKSAIYYFNKWGWRWI
jgi:GT2 family glycosyltransferase